MGGKICGKDQDGKQTLEYCRAMFIFERIVGKGGFGRVWKVKDKKKKDIYALKVIDKARVISKKSVQSILNQREILSTLLQDKSKFIVNMHCAFQDRENLYLLMDFMDAADLRYYINRSVVFNETQVKFMVRCLMEGLRCLHRRNIIHRDLKPQNIILDSKGYACITDLGIARYWKCQNSHQTSGTPGYMAPQVLLRQNHSFGVDFYAIGVIAYELLIGKRPYTGRDRKTIRQEMLARQAKIPAYFSGLSSQCEDFVNRLLQRVPKKRLGYNGLTEVFSHPWLAITGQEELNFLSKQMASPIIPLQIKYSQSLQQNTEPDDLWRENMLLLKRKDVQTMFQGYNFNIVEQQRTVSKSEANTTLPPVALAKA